VRPEPGCPLSGAPGYLEAEAVYAAGNEGALHLEDTIARRTHAAMETPDRGLAAAPRIAELMGEVLGWNAARREVAAYRALVEGDRLAEAQTDDEAAAVRAARIRQG